jgi:hypothetical protein
LDKKPFQLSILFFAVFQIHPETRVDRHGSFTDFRIQSLQLSNLVFILLPLNLVQPSLRLLQRLNLLFIPHNQLVFIFILPLQQLLLNKLGSVPNNLHLALLPVELRVEFKVLLSVLPAAPFQLYNTLSQLLNSVPCNEQLLFNNRFLNPTLLHFLPFLKQLFFELTLLIK